jgi:predicted RNA-binding protein with PUA-like domain
MVDQVISGIPVIPMEPVERLALLWGRGPWGKEEGRSEPDDWSWAQQVEKGREGAEWNGIRNFLAQNHLRAMKKGDQAFFYHTGKERAIIGIVKVIAEAHPDSTDSAWRAVDVAAVRPLPTPVGLARIKADKRLAGMPLVRIPRLSVQPVSDAEWRIVCEMGGLG